MDEMDRRSRRGCLRHCHVWTHFPRRTAEQLVRTGRIGPYWMTEGERTPMAHGWTCGKVVVSGRFLGWTAAAKGWRVEALTSAASGPRHQRLCTTATHLFYWIRHHPPSLGCGKTAGRGVLLLLDGVHSITFTARTEIQSRGHRCPAAAQASPDRSH